MHYTGMQSERESLKKLISPKSKVSCHYFINRKGMIFRLVKEQNIAWHAGKSRWGKYKNLNKNSIGIELENRGHKFGYQTYTKKQLKKLTGLCKNLKRKYKIKNKHILGHSDIAPLRKIDPGEKFQWDNLASKELRINFTKPNIKNKRKKTNEIKKFFNNLNLRGYRYLNKKFKKKIIKNFQRRFRQNGVSGILDLETLKISEILAKKSNLA